MPVGLAQRISGDLRTLPRQFWLLAAGNLVYLIGVEMCYPFETIYLNRHLGVSMTTLGLILGITIFATLPMQMVGGALCDKVGRRPVLSQTRRIRARISMATAIMHSEASTGCQTGAHHSSGMRNSRSRVPGDDGQRTNTHSHT